MDRNSKPERKGVSGHQKSKGNDVLVKSTVLACKERLIPMEKGKSEGQCVPETRTIRPWGFCGLEVRSFLRPGFDPF